MKNNKAPHYLKNLINSDQDFVTIVENLIANDTQEQAQLDKKDYQTAIISAANIYKNGEDSTGKKIVADLDKARSFFIKACDNHEGSVCNEIGKELSSPNRKDVDFVAATEFFEKGCNVNNYEACTNLGVLYAGTNELRRNFDKSYQYFVKACSGQNAEWNCI